MIGTGRTRAGRRTAAGTAAAAIAALILAGCGAEEAAEPEPLAVPAPAPAPPVGPDAPADPDADPADPTDADPADPDADPADDAPSIGDIAPELGWPWDEDLARLDAFPRLLDAAFDEGSEAGLHFLAEHSWPDGFTADAMLACRLPEPTPTYAQLDADRWRHRIEFIPVAPVPGFQYPPTGQYPADLGLRIYLGRLIVTTEVDGEPTDTYDDIARLAVRPDGTVVMFPMCFEFLPGGWFAHRVTDGHVGGYTDAEAEGDIRSLFTNSSDALQAEACGRLAAGAIDDLFLMIVPYDIEFTDAAIPRPVMERTVTDLCEARVR